MANVTADNAQYQGRVAWWLNIGADTPVVYTYTCSVDDHLLVSLTNLSEASATCPHHTGAALENETAVDVS